MDQGSQTKHKYQLESQIREAYGRLLYTQTTHNKKMESLNRKNKYLKNSQIILSALSTTGFVFTVFTDRIITSIVGGILSLLLLMINIYFKNYDLIEEAQQHQSAAQDLWVIREDYVSLLVDLNYLDIKEIIEKRSKLQYRTSEVYKHSPPTDEKSYKAAQKAIKHEEEQTFSDQELDKILPKSQSRIKQKNSK